VIVRIYSWFAIVLFLVLMFPRVLLGEPSSQFPVSTPNTSAQGPEDDELKKWKKDALKKANKERQADIQRDTEKLFKLASELKEYVGKTDEHILSLDVIKKAEEIEKLAHDVKEKMKTSY
jgi:hypothetical protein